MRYLIDGYNLMHARGMMAPRFGPNGLRNARRRFLNDLAAALGPVESARCTVVFDASQPPPGARREEIEKGLNIIFAVDEDDADARIESLIASHPAPKRLTVVSSDLRLRRAALRRGAVSLTADAFAVSLDGRRSRRSPPQLPSTPGSDDRIRRLRERGPSPSEAADWLVVFGDLDEELRATDPRGSAGLTDAEIARLEREIASEDDASRHKPR